MRVLSNWRLHGLLGFVVVAGGLGWMAHERPTDISLPQWVSQRLALTPAAPLNPASLVADYGRMPLHFEPNLGQTHRDVKFMAQGGGYSLFLTSNEAVLRLSRATSDKSQAATGVVLRARLEGANAKAIASGNEPQESYSNYFIGNDSRRWQTAVPHYSRVHYDSVWPGIDLVYYGNQRQLEYDFIVQPGANPGLIRMSWHGADNLFIDNDGNLIAETALGPVRQHKPVVYQDIAGKRRSVDSRYALAGNKVSFELGNYDHTQPLVIDPVLSYSTYLGGGTLENFNLTGIAVTSKGSAVVTGYTDSPTFPVTTGSYRLDRGASYNTVVSRIGYNGGALLYSTYLGSTSNPSRGNAIAINEAGEAYVAGSTEASDYPLTPVALGTPYQDSKASNKATGFVTRLSADGKTLVYSTYLGGSSSTASNGDRINAIVVNAAGQAYVTGSTDSTAFPVGGSTLPVKPAGSNSGFVSRLSANGSALDFTTILSGSGNDQPRALALGSSAIFIAGTTSSTDLPSALGSLSGSSDAFVSKLAADGSSVSYSRYVGGSNDEEGNAVAVDSTGHVWIAGSSKSAGFPVVNASDSVSKTEGADSPFLTQLDSSGTLTISRILGSAGKATAVAVNSSDKVLVAGQMTAVFPLKNALTAVTTSDNNNGFIQQWNGSTNTFSSALGGSLGEDSINAMALNAAGAVYVAGTTRSATFPTINQAYGYVDGNYAVNGFAGKIGFGPSISLSQSSSSTGINKDFTLTWKTTGAANCHWDGEGNLPPGQVANGSRTQQLSSLGSKDYTLYCEAADGEMSSATVTITIVPPPTASISISPNPVALNQAFTMVWSSTNTNSNSCSVTTSTTDPDSGEEISSTSYVTPNGSYTNNGGISIAARYKYELLCNGAGADTPASSIFYLDAAPRPALTLNATPSSNPLVLNSTVTYNWTASPTTGAGAVSCTASGVITGPRSAVGSETVIMNTEGEKTLTLKCVGAGGEETSVSKSTTVNVLNQNYAPVIEIFAPEPETQTSIQRYQSVELKWKVRNAVSCSAVTDANGGTSTYPGNWNWSNKTDFDSKWIVTPQSVGPHDYTLNCTGPGGPSSETITINVTPPPPAQVSTLTVSTSSIPLGDSTIIQWRALYADSCVASGDWSGNKNTSGSILFTPTRKGSHEFILDCDGATAPGSASVSLMVTAPASTGDDEDSGDDSGGPVDLLLLAGLGLLGLTRRRLHS